MRESPWLLELFPKISLQCCFPGYMKAWSLKLKSCTVRSLKKRKWSFVRVRFSTLCLQDHLKLSWRAFELMRLGCERVLRFTIFSGISLESSMRKLFQSFLMVKRTDQSFLILSLSSHWSNSKRRYFQNFMRRRMSIFWTLRQTFSKTKSLRLQNKWMNFFTSSKDLSIFLTSPDQTKSTQIFSKF